MKKKNGIIVLIIVLSVAVIAGVGYKIADKFYAPLVQTKAVSYLCHKYDAKPDEFEIVDYCKAHIFWDDKNIFYLTPNFVDCSFEFKYKDENFIVCRKGSHFYDDYQLDYLETQLTEWMQKNINTVIFGIEIESTDIFDYCKYVKSNDVLGENDIEPFMKWLFNYDVSERKIIVDSINDNGIENRISARLSVNAQVSVSTSGSDMETFAFKSNDELWYRSFFPTSIINRLNSLSE